MLDDPLYGIAPVGEEAEPRDLQKVGAQIAVYQNEEGYDGKRGTDAPPCPFHDEQEGEGADNQVNLDRHSCTVNEAVEFQKYKDRKGRRHENKKNIEVGNVIALVIERTG